MKLTVKTKIISGLVIILLIGIVSMLLVFSGLKDVERNVEKLARVHEPFILAAYEMEINMDSIGLLVLKYLNTRGDRYRKLATKDMRDFAEFHATYRKLIASDEERMLDARITKLYGEFEELGKTLMQRGDEQETLFQMLSVHIEGIDDIINSKLQPHIFAVREVSKSKLDKVIASSNMEAEIAEVGFWVANYRRLQNPDFISEIDEKIASFAKALSDFESLDLTDKERPLARAVREIFERLRGEVHDVVALEGHLNRQRDRFIHLRLEMDNMLDDEIQPLARQHLTLPRQEAEAAAERSVAALRLLIPGYLVCALLIALFIIRSVIDPLNRLKAGTTAVGAGDLQHRIKVHGTDEFSELAAQFNDMVAKLRATTVSKGALEESQRKLQATVADLRHEISEREQAQAEQVALQAALRRSETMSVLGALVAGVAHEVRNPLFSISATVDTMDVRFAGREELQPYSEVLRVEVDRLVKLMADLFEYGKPAASEMLPASIGEVISQAVQVCVSDAERAKVAIVPRIQPDIPLLRMDRSRLLQVFRNLLENAIQHSPEHSDVCISAQDTDDNHVTCSVADSGPGFRAEDLKSVFDPFFTRRRGGTGLGLSIVWRIVEDHGGTVRAANREQGGAIVTICLPNHFMPVKQQASPKAVAAQIELGTEDS